MTERYEPLLHAARVLVRMLKSDAPDCIIGQCIWHLFIRAAGSGSAVTAEMSDWIRARAKVSAGLCSEPACANAINPRFSDPPLCERCDAREQLVDDSLGEAEFE